MFRYEQSTGRFWQLVGTGYSGHDEARNQPDLEDVKGRGPIPRGRWKIGPPFHHSEAGPLVMRLEPEPGTDVHGRDGFLIHGDSFPAPGTASRGCIVLDRSARTVIANSGDHELEVVR